MFADYHVHTEFSDDSVYPIEQVVKDAIAMGMTELCFTDHVDYGIKEDWDCGRPIASGRCALCQCGLSHRHFPPGHRRRQGH